MMIIVRIKNESNYPAKAHLRDHYCMYDVNKNRNFDLGPGAEVIIRAETKASGGCFFVDSSMTYEMFVVVPSISPIKVGECRIVKDGDYLWRCPDQSVSDFRIRAVSGFDLRIQSTR